MDWNLKIKHLMGEATSLVRKGQLADATRAIQKTLGGAVARDTPAASTASTDAPALQAPSPAAAEAPFWRRPGLHADVEDATVIDRSGNHAPGAASPRADDASAEPPGSFSRVVFTDPGSRHAQHHYHLYVPPGTTAGTPMPLVLMLHGCTQNPEDFATGTGMNAAAAPVNALVLYPEQPHSANPNACWNWFRPGDQHRDGGEPALLMAMVRDVMARHTVDQHRVYVAGLSAGGAMAALLGREYPDVFAAVGVHSGLQAGAAHSVMAALSAMKNGAKPGAAAHRGAAPTALPPPPTIVLHGDADPTVHARNGEQLIQAALAAHAGVSGGGKPAQEIHRGQSPQGQAYTRTTYLGTQGDGTNAVTPTVLAEHWVLHGAGHAWSGGNTQGSHTDPQGVNATEEMLRFFLAHPANRTMN